MQWDQFGIANHLGEPWTPRTFDTREAAQHYLDINRQNWPKPHGLDDHVVVPVTVTVEIKPAS